MSMQPHTEFVPALQLSSLAAVRLAPNPGPMSLEGTNSYILRGAGSEHAVIVDPGPDHAGHLAALAAESVELILITHRHHDHTEGIDTLHRLTGAPVRAFLPEHCREARAAARRRVDRGRRNADPGACHPGPHLRLAVLLPARRRRPTVPCSPATPSWAAAPPSWTRPTARWATTWPPWTGWPRRPTRWCCPRTARCWSRCTRSLPSTARIAWRAWSKSVRHWRICAPPASSEPGIAQVADVVYADVDPSVRGAAEISVAAQLRYLGDLGEY